MTSILTNTSSMVALQTLKGINNDLESIQSQISTGKSVASAKDNSAVWAISKVMESDVNGFEAISDSLALGESTVAVARQASETVTDLLTEMKGKIVAAQEDNVDLDKIQADIDALTGQISSVVGAAQFNGLNLVDGSTASATVLSSLDRDSSGNVTPSHITVSAQDLSFGAYVGESVFDAGNGSATVSGTGDTFSMSLDEGGGAEVITISNGGTWAAGDSISLRIGDQTASYTVSASDVAGTNTIDDLVAVGLKDAINSLGIDGLEVDYDSASPGELTFSNTAAAVDGGTDLQVTGQYTNAGAGGLGAVSAIDVTTDAAGALGSIETMIDNAIDAAASFGSVEGRIETQSDFISGLSDSLTAGIGSMVDADMEEASARLQALQVQQQLGIQSLSIANSSPSSVMSLFQ